MKRILILALAAAMIAPSAAAFQRFRLVVPVEIENVPAGVQRGRIRCTVSSAASFDATRSLGSGDEDFAIEGGRFSGRVGVDIILGGVPAGADATTEGRSYSCSLFLMYQCTSPETSDMTWCVTSAGARVRPDAHPAVRTMFAPDPARPPSGIIQGTIDRAGATTLPVRDL